MTHYSLMVLTEKNPYDEVEVTEDVMIDGKLVLKGQSAQALALALAPYDENTPVTPYRVYETREPEQHWAVESFREKGLLPAEGEVTWAMVIEAYGKEYPPEPGEESDAPIFDEDNPAKAYTISTRNPQSKWDWWVVGGRWSNRLIPTQGDGPTVADSLQRYRLDITQMRGQAELMFRDKWTGPRDYVLNTRGLTHRSWDEIRDAYAPDFDTARNLYHGQASIAALKSQLPEEEARWLVGGQEVDQVLVDDREWERQIKILVAGAVPCINTLGLDGQWHEPGETGWFGSSTATESTRIGYYEAMNAMIEALDDQVWITVVDCHI